MKLSECGRFRVTAEALTSTEQQLRYAGAEGYECWVLWSGVLGDGRFEVRNVHVPEQVAYRSEHGLSVEVKGAALHKLNLWLLEHREILGAQVHAHPTEAFHSDTDNNYSIVAAIGGLSLVAAHFCRHGLRSSSTAAFRLSGEGWRPSTRPARRLLEVA